MTILDQATRDAEAAKAKADSGEVVAGPFPVGNIGHVSVVERAMGDSKYLYARFVGTGRPAQVPLAACATIVDALREEDAPEED